MHITTLVSQAFKKGASDLHLVSGQPPYFRIDGRIVQSDYAVSCPEQDICRMLINKMFEDLDIRNIETLKEFDLCINISGIRCRLNFYKTRGKWNVAIRLLRDEIPVLSDLGLPDTIADFTKYNSGLVLVTGETGSGKSTTLAALINKINQEEHKHILTLEDPIEYIYKPENCMISQRGIGEDTSSFAKGLRAALREDPDIILVGEMRDLETIETALTAAETGHLVFGTLHTNSAADSINRLVGIFPAVQQDQIRLQLSSTLRAVLSQRLLPKVGGGRVLVYEIMKVDTAISNLIRTGGPQIESTIQTTGNLGNILMDRCLKNLKDKGLIDEDIFQSNLKDKEANQYNRMKQTQIKKSAWSM